MASRVQENPKITYSLIRARLDVLIFLRVQEQSTYFTVIDDSGKSRLLSSLSIDERLNFPSVARVGWAVRRVRSVAPALAAEYRRQVRTWYEANDRFIATGTRPRWEKYLAHKVYRTKIATNRNGGENHYRLYVCRYLSDELKPRLKERQRARMQMRQADKRMEELRERIYEAMNIPSGMRGYVL